MVAIRRDVWKGFDEEKIKAMSMEEFMEIVGSRERRTLKRLNSNPKLKKFIEKVRKTKEKDPKKTIKTQIREAVILPEWLGLTFGVYNGKEYVLVKIVGEMLGHRLGEFSVTRKQIKHGAPGIGATRSSAAMSVK